MPTYGGDTNEFPVVKYDGHATYAPTTNEVTVATARGRVPTPEGSGAASAALAALSGFANVPALALCGASALSNWVNKWNRDAGYSQSSFLIGGVMAADGFLSNVSTGLYHAMTGGGCSGPTAVPPPMGTGGAGCSCDSIQGMIDALGGEVHGWIDGIPAAPDNSAAIAGVGSQVAQVMRMVHNSAVFSLVPYKDNPLFYLYMGQVQGFHVDDQNGVYVDFGWEIDTFTGDNAAVWTAVRGVRTDSRNPGEGTVDWLHRVCPEVSWDAAGLMITGVGFTRSAMPRFIYPWDAWGWMLGYSESLAGRSGNPLFTFEGSLTSSERTALDGVSVHGLESLPLSDMLSGLNAALPGWDFVASDDGQFPRGTIPSSGSRVWFNLLPCGVDRANNYAYVPTSGAPERSVQRDLVDLMSLVPFTPGTRDRP